MCQGVEAPAQAEVAGGRWVYDSQESVTGLQMVKWLDIRSETGDSASQYNQQPVIAMIIPCWFMQLVEG